MLSPLAPTIDLSGPEDAVPEILIGPLARSVAVGRDGDVRADKSDTDEAGAGGRCLASPKQLTGKKMITLDHPIPSQVLILKQGFVPSLTENVQLAAIEAMDRVDVSGARVANGVQAADIARRFDLPVSKSAPRHFGSDWTAFEFSGQAQIFHAGCWASSCRKPESLLQDRSGAIQPHRGS